MHVVLALTICTVLSASVPAQSKEFGQYLEASHSKKTEPDRRAAARTEVPRLVDARCKLSPDNKNRALAHSKMGDDALMDVWLEDRKRYAQSGFLVSAAHRRLAMQGD